MQAKWPHFRAAFRGFKIPAVARFRYRDIRRRLDDPDLIRNAKKIQATVDNAQTLEDLAREHGSVKRYLRSLRRLMYAQKVKELSRRFRYLGPTGVYFFLWCVGEDVPEWKDRRSRD